MLLGRDPELRLLRQLLDDARAGRSGVLALVGDAGIGKSALLDETEALASGMRVLRARGIQSEAQIPFAGLFELLRPALARLERIPPPQAVALESALALRPARPHDRFAVGAATLSLLAAFAEEEPVAVLVDDAHWLDGSTADALLFTARRLLADPVALVLTTRPDTPSLLDGADLPVLEVTGLPSDAAAELVRRDAPGTGAEAAKRLYRDTGGNPLALLELAKARPAALPLDAPVPVRTSVAEEYVRRAASLPERTRELLVLAAATDRGEPAVLGRAAPALGLDLGDLAPAEEAGLVTTRDGRLEFRHPLARSALYAAARPEARRSVHRALADALPDADADRRAWHLALAATGLDGAAASALEQAGMRARERSAYDVASQAYERAALLDPSQQRRGQLLVAAADAAWLGGLPDRALTLLDGTVGRTGGEPELAVEYLRGIIALRRGPVAEGRRILLEAAPRATPTLAASMLAEAGLGAFYAADAAGLETCAARARELTSLDSSERVRFFALVTSGMAAILSGHGEPGAASIREAVDVLEDSGELRSEPLLLYWAVAGPLWLREADVDRQLVDRAVATARAASAAGVLPHLLSHVGIEQAATDHWIEAQAAFDEAIRLARETGQRVVLAAALSRLGWLEARLGREQACRAHAGEALALARELGVVLCEIWSLGALGELELGLGNAAAVLERFSELDAVLARQGIADPDVMPAPEQVEAHLRLGDEAAARAAAQRFSAAADAKGQPWARARAARCHVLITADDDAAARFEQALALHAETPDVFEAARTRLVYGARLRRGGRRSDAREPLRAALAVFDDLGARPWAEATRTELAATGETARRREPSSLDELTPQELQVGLLLAEGKTTKEAAAALFLSPKTIEYHLRNAYRKLAIHSRDELREALHVQHALPRD